MTISTVLRLMRGAAKASLKAGKFAIDTSGKLLKTGARAVKHSRMTPEERREAKRKEKRKDKTKKAIKKTGETAVKATGHIISEGFIFFVELVEDFSVLLIVVILIFALILLVCVVSVFGTFSAVITTDATSSSSSDKYGLGTTSSGTRGGVKITDPSTYDWWGNKDANMLLLNDNKDKELYQIIACNAELQKYGLNDTSNKKLWNIYNGIGLLMSEMGGGMYDSDMGLHNPGSQEEIDQIINDKCNYVFAYHTAGGGDGLGDGPIGLTWNYAENKSYDFGPFSIKNVNKEYLKDSITKSGRGYTDNQGYAQWTLPGGLKWCYDNSYEYSLDSKINFSTGEKISDLFDRWGIEKNESNLLSFAVTDYYAKHHGCGDEDRAYVLEYILALYKYADNSLNNISYVDSSGNYSTAFVGRGHGHMMEFLENYVGMSERGSNIQVIHDGKKIVYDYESGNTLAKALLNWAKSNNADGYTHLKAALEWGATYAPDYKAGGNPKAYNFSSYTSNLVACLGVYFSGQTTVNYMVDKLGIVFESEDGEDSSIEVSRSTPGGTMTAKNVVATAQKIYSEHGVNSSDPWTYGNYDLVYGQNGKFIECKNSNADWCAMFVTTVLYRAKINGSNMSVGEALHKETGGNFPTSQSADCGYSPYTGNHCNLYTATSGDSNRSCITGSGCVIVHNLGNVPNAYGDSDVHSTATKDSNGKISKDSGYVPKAGDIIIYSWDGYHLFSHVGLVCEDGKGTYDAQTIEGNTGPGSCVNKKNGAANAGKQVSTYVEINYAELERKYGKSSTSSTTDESGVFKVDSFVKNKVKTGLGSLDNKTKKFIDVSVDGTSCKVTTYEKSANDKWDTGPVSLSEGYVGSKGVGSSYEGSNITPYGTYYCRTGFGNGTKDSLGIKMKTWYNIGDGGTHIWSGSGTSAGFDGGKGIEINKYYNKSINGGTGAENLTSYVGYAYKYAMFIEYNSGKGAKAGGGSAFFLHVGSQPTAGCVAISESDMLKIAKWADDNTVICIHKSNEVIDRQSSKSK